MKGEELTISYKVNPENSKVESESWSSSDEKIVSVEKGKIKALSCGTSTVTLIVNDKVKKSVLVTVHSEIEDIVFDESEINLDVGKYFVANIEVIPSDVTDIQLIWTSSDESIAKVTNGKIEALKSGVAIISAESSNNKIAKLTVTVSNSNESNTNKSNTNKSNTNVSNTNVSNTNKSNIKVESIRMSKNSDTIRVGNSIKLSAIINPSNASDKSIMWTSSNSSVATVKNGTIVAKKAGETIITAKTSNGKTATCKIKVVNKTYGKTAIFFGDSITEVCYLDKDDSCTASNLKKTWANLIGENKNYNITITNAGKHGWLITRSWGVNYWIRKSVEKYNGRKYDYVILNGGINNIHAKVDLGQYKKIDSDEDFDSNVLHRTLASGLEHTYIQ